MSYILLNYGNLCSVASLQRADNSVIGGWPDRGQPGGVIAVSRAIAGATGSQNSISLHLGHDGLSLNWVKHVRW